MVYIPYHSGSVSPEQAESPVGRAAPVADVARSAPPAPAFRIVFRTSALRPSHRVTIRNAVDGWERDMYGVYRDGGWEFELPRERYPAELQMKLLLEPIFRLKSSSRQTLTRNTSGN